MFFKRKKKDCMHEELQRINEEADRNARARQEMWSNEATQQDARRAEPTGPFRMTISDVFSITGRGTVITGEIESGHINTGDTVRIGSNILRIRGIEMFRRTSDSAKAGDKVGLVVDAPRNQFERGQVITN